VIAPAPSEAKFNSLISFLGRISEAITLPAFHIFSCNIHILISHIAKTKQSQVVIFTGTLSTLLGKMPKCIITKRVR
jgi:hypothetical protein